MAYLTEWLNKPILGADHLVPLHAIYTLPFVSLTRSGNILQVALVYPVTDVSPGARESAQYTLLGWFVRQSLRRLEELASVCEYPAIPWHEILSFDVRALLPGMLQLLT